MSNQAEALWNDLAGTDPAKAHLSMRTLSAAPQQALPLFKDRLKAVPEPDAKRIPQLLMDLDCMQFAVRQKAEEDLEKLGELAEPALRSLVESKPGLETEKRAQKLLEKIVTVQSLPPDQLQAVRTLAVLEQIDTPEARQVLEALTKGAAGARLTKEAKGVLQRMSTR